MSYQRFVLPVPPATLATSATFQRSSTLTVAKLASVAGHFVQPAEYNGVAEADPTLAAASTDSSDLLYRDRTSAQRDPSRCFVCDQAFSADDAVISVLSGIPDQRFWLHHTCHDEHIRRCMAARDQVPVLGPASMH